MINYVTAAKFVCVCFQNICIGYASSCISRIAYADFVVNQRQRKPKGQLRIDNPETLVTLDTQRHKTQDEDNTENLKDEHQGPHQKLGVNPGAREG